MFDSPSAQAEAMSTKAAYTRQLGMLHNPTTRERLEQQKAQLEEAVENVDAAIKALDENPSAEAVMNALRKCGI